MQESTILQLKIVNPEGRFWIKLDATDMQPGIFESMRGVWNGDTDLGNGELMRLRAQYDERKAEFHTLLSKQNKEQLVEDLEIVIERLEDDKTFLGNGFAEAKRKYAAKFNAPNTPQETLKSLNWEIVEFQVLLQQCQILVAKLKDLLANNIFDSTDTVKVNREIKALNDDVMGYLRDIFKKKRQPPADHILVILLSDERRNKKPYALPVSYHPYSSLSDAYVRDLTRSIKSKMKEQNLNVVGMYTEWNSLLGETQHHAVSFHGIASMIVLIKKLVKKFLVPFEDIQYRPCKH